MQALIRNPEKERLPACGPVIFLKERYISMLKNDMVFNHPLRSLGNETDDILPAGGFGAVLARAGIGKTSILVQLALDSMLRETKVLHISLDDPVKKVCLWYEEIFRNISKQSRVGEPERLWDSILPRRLVMTFNVDSFSVPKFRERLEDLIVQNIFTPGMMMVDGFPFDEAGKRMLPELKEFAKEHAMGVWFAIRIQRHEVVSDPNEIPDPFKDVAHLFDTIFQLRPEGKQIHLNVVKTKKDGSRDADSALVLDPSTMLVGDCAE